MPNRLSPVAPPRHGQPRHRLSLTDILASWVTRAGLRFMLIVDVVLIGMFASAYLAPVGLAYSLGGVLYSIAQGLLIGCLTLTAATPDATASENGIILRDGLIITVVCGTLLALLCQGGSAFMRLIGQEPEIANLAGPFLMLLGLGLPLHYAFMTLGFMLEGKGHRKVVAFWVGSGFLINLLAGFALALVFVWSDQTIAWSIAITTIVVRCIALVGLVVSFEARVALAPRADLPRWVPETGRKLRRIGSAAGAGLAIESAAFAMLSVYAGWLGAPALAAYTLLNSLVSVIFSLALAIAVLTATRIAADRDSARLRFTEGLLMALGLMGLLGLIAFAFRGPLINQTLTDPMAAAIALPLVGVVGILMLGDGGQAIASNALRAVGDAWPATLIHLSGYLVLMVGGGWLLAIPLERGVRGLMEATALASFAVLFFLTWRFYWLTRASPLSTTTETLT